MGVMADHQRRAGFNGGAGKLLLRGVRRLGVFDAGVHGDNRNIG